MIYNNWLTDIVVKVNNEDITNSAVLFLWRLGQQKYAENIPYDKVLKLIATLMENDRVELIDPDLKPERTIFKFKVVPSFQRLKKYGAIPTIEQINAYGGVSDREYSWYSIYNITKNYGEGDFETCTFIDTSYTDIQYQVYQWLIEDSRRYL